MNINELKEQNEVYEEELLKTTENLEAKTQEVFKLMEDIDNYKNQMEQNNQKLNEITEENNNYKTQ